MFEPPDYTVLEGTDAAYRNFYPARRRTPPPAGATDVTVPVAEGVEIGCRLYPGGAGDPSLLYFHGNGETVPDYDDVAPLFTRFGLNVFVADYRGYGFSTGSPSFPTMLSDAHLILEAFVKVCDGTRFVMGRSMGGHSAVELAAHHPDLLNGLILESSAPFIARQLEDLEPPKAADLEARHLEKIRAINIPMLAIHGEWDELIPIDRAVAFFETITTPQKRMERIPRAGHNDILWVGMEQYLGALRTFVGLDN